MSNQLEQSLLNKNTQYPQHYAPDTLFALPRSQARNSLGIDEQALPFMGVDIWNAYELSWLNKKGKPQVAIARFIFPCQSPCLIESKSLKLYLNSLNNCCFDHLQAVQQTIANDLSVAAQAAVTVVITDLQQHYAQHGKLTGICLDDLDICCKQYDAIDPTLLIVGNEITKQTVYSDLYKSNCPVTAQPDWASVQISYCGKKIDHAGLLRYLISSRNHSAFHEQCVERIFQDIMQHCQPQSLSVYARYTRRGGLDINPFRSSDTSLPDQQFQLGRQ